MNPTLISGFEDIMTHIKNQGERIKALEANEKVREERTQELYLENQKLKEDLEKAWDQRGDNRRKARNKNLEKENKELKEKVICLESDAVDAENEIEKVKEEKYSLYAKWQERGEEVKELEAKCATKDYKLTNGIVVQATQSEIDICEIYEKKLDRQFEEMDEEIKYHFRDSP